MLRGLLRDWLFQKHVRVRLDDKNFENNFVIDDGNLVRELRSLGRFRYVPNMGNLGDCLIATATYQFFDKYGLMDCLTDDANCENIVYGGGGVWVSNLYAEIYRPVLEVFQKAERVIILPSSIFDCPALIDVLDSRFVVFCREENTYLYLRRARTGAKLFLDSDMALRMNREVLDVVLSTKFLYVKTVEEILRRIKNKGDLVFFLRKDVESRGNGVRSDFDLSAAFSPDMTENECQFATMLMLATVDWFEVIVTDRLHVGIAGLLMGKEVYLLDNSYGKISSVYRRSFYNIKNAHLIQDLSEVKNSKNRSGKTHNLNCLFACLV